MAAVPVKYRITWVKAAILLSIAVISWGAQVLCDLTGVLAVVSSIIGIVVGILLPFLCGLMGVKFSPKIVTTFISEAVIGILPFVDIFPAYVIGTAYVIYTSRAEDRMNAKRDAQRMREARNLAEYRRNVFAARRNLEGTRLNPSYASSFDSRSIPPSFRGRITASSPVSSTTAPRTSLPAMISIPAKLKVSTPRTRYEVPFEKYAQQLETERSRIPGLSPQRVGSVPRPPERSRPAPLNPEALERAPLASTLDDDAIFSDIYSRLFAKRPDKVPDQIRLEAEREYERNYPGRLAAYNDRIYTDIRQDPAYKKYFRERRYGGRDKSEHDPGDRRDFWWDLGNDKANRYAAINKDAAEALREREELRDQSATYRENERRRNGTR